MKAVVMAGGEGSRLRPLTSSMPKPLVPVAGRPIMEHILLHLRRHQLRDVVATVQYLGASIRNYFGDGSEQGVGRGACNRLIHYIYSVSGKHPWWLVGGHVESAFEATLAVAVLGPNAGPQPEPGVAIARV